MGKVAYLNGCPPVEQQAVSPHKASEGFTPLPNLVQSALCKVKLTGRQQRVVNTIIDKTFRWHKAWDRIALTTFAKQTSVATKHLPAIIRSLEQRKIVNVQRFDDGRTNQYQLNREVDEWAYSPPKKSKSTPILGSTAPQNREKESLARETQKNSFQNNFKEKEEKTICAEQKLTVSQMEEHCLRNGTWGRFELTDETHDELQAEFQNWWRSFGGMGAAVSQFLDLHSLNYPSLSLTAGGWQARFKGYVRNRMNGALPYFADVGPDGYGEYKAMQVKLSNLEGV